ncbi:MAG: hypothetical protein AB7P17_06650 [Nitrospirales bacterium]
MIQHDDGGKCRSAREWGWQRCCAALMMSGWLFTVACTTLESAGYAIYEDRDTLVRLEPIRRIPALSEVGLAHPVALTQLQIESLLTSISARNKIGLLGSFKGTPGVPRLFGKDDIDILSESLQEAFAKANSQEVIVFYRAKNGENSRQLVTSGMMFVQERNLVVSVANFWHPLITAAFEVGGTDKLQDIRETTTYVRDFPWNSVGEQDFAIFFDDPRYETAQRQSRLFGYPERTLSIAYQGYLKVNPDSNEEIQQPDNGMFESTQGKSESQIIAELRKRITELEQANANIRAAMQEPTGAQSASSLLPPEPTSNNIQKQDVHAQLQETVKDLERRVADLEKRLNNNVKTRRTGVPTK